MNKGITKYLVIAAVLLGLGGSRAWAANVDTEDGTITVTPVATVTLALSATTYAFGNVDIQTSTVTGHFLTLTNSGNIDAAITKQVPSNNGLWVSDTSSTTANHYILYVATSATSPLSNGSEFTSTHMFGTATTNNPLKGLSSLSNVTLSATGGATPSTKLWFRLDMPMSVTSTTPQELFIRFTGTAL